jgi:hypothetical protein
MDELLASLEGYEIAADWAPVGEPKDLHLDCLQCRQVMCPVREGDSLLSLAQSALNHACPA